MNLFGRKKKPAAPVKPTAEKTREVIGNLRTKVDKLEKRQTFVQAKINKCLADAKEQSKRKNKKGALMALKRKQMYEKELSTYTGAQLTLEQQIMTLEGAAINRDIYDGMATGAAALKEAQGAVSVEAVDDVMDDIAEGQAQQAEIGEALGGSMGATLEDDEDLLAELGELEEEAAGADLFAAPTVPTGGVAAPAPASAVPSMPSAPTHVPVAAATDEEAELAALEASMM